MLRPCVLLQNLRLIFTVDSQVFLEDQYFTRCDQFAQKCNIFLRKTNEACSFVIDECSSCGSTGEQARDMASSPFSLTAYKYFTILVHEKLIQNAENKTKSRGKIFEIYSLYGFYPPVVIIHKCYQTYCEFRLKMHFVPMNM